MHKDDVHTNATCCAATASPFCRSLAARSPSWLTAAASSASMLAKAACRSVAVPVVALVTAPSTAASPSSDSCCASSLCCSRSSLSKLCDSSSSAAKSCCSSAVSSNMAARVVFLPWYRAPSAPRSMAPRMRRRAGCCACACSSSSDASSTAPCPSLSGASGSCSVRIRCVVSFMQCDNGGKPAPPPGVNSSANSSATYFRLPMLRACVAVIRWVMLTNCVWHWRAIPGCQCVMT